MSGRVTWLSGLLALQLVIIAVVLLAEVGFGAADQGPFLTFERAAVDEIRITGDGDDPQTLVLARGDDGWRLPDGLPANQDKISSMLDKLAGLQAPWPVATSGNAAERFEVTDDTFQRHVVLMAGDDAVADLYLGTSPGYQQVHARRAADDEVYSVALSNYQLPASPDDWLDKTLLQPEGEVSTVVRQGAWEMNRGEEGWLLEGAAADSDAAEDLVRRIDELRVNGVAKAPEQAAEPAAVFAVTDDQGTYHLRLYGSGEDDQYRVSSDRREGVFSLASYVADQLLVDQDALVATTDESAQDEAGPGDAPAVTAKATEKDSDA